MVSIVRRAWISCRTCTTYCCTLGRRNSLSVRREAYAAVSEDTDDEARVPTMAEVALRQAEAREAALARKVAAMELELNRGKQMLAVQQRVKDVLTARVDTTRGYVREPVDAGQVPLSVREVKVRPNGCQVAAKMFTPAAVVQFHERGREIYGSAWDEPGPDGGMSLAETFSLPESEVKALQQEAREVLTSRQQGDDALACVCVCVCVWY
jgi:hypothetical protein